MSESEASFMQVALSRWLGSISKLTTSRPLESTLKPMLLMVGGWLALGAVGCAEESSAGEPWRLGPEAQTGGEACPGDASCPAPPEDARNTSAIQCDSEERVCLRAVSAGNFHTCALSVAGEVYCWGDGGDGELGHGVEETRATPVRVEGLPEASAIAAGGPGRTCAALTEGGVRCWGDGELGRETPLTSASPVEVAGLEARIVSLSTAISHTCAVSADGRIDCWGQQNHGELGDGSVGSRETPVKVRGIDDAVAVSTGGAGHSCAIRSGGSLSCWGYNNYGQLGNGESGEETSKSTPVSVSLSEVTDVSAGGRHTCAITRDDRVWCWGNGSGGQTGRGTPNAQTAPAPVQATSGTVDVASGLAHTCAVYESGRVACWGDNSDGDLGNNRLERTSSPTRVEGIEQAVSIAAGDDHTCAVLEDGRLRCWGRGQEGQLGHGERDNASTPVEVDFSAIEEAR